MTSARTNLEHYLYVSIQMLLAREDGKDQDAFLDKLDELWEKLSPEEVAFIADFRQSQEKKAAE